MNKYNLFIIIFIIILMLTGFERTQKNKFDKDLASEKLKLCEAHYLKMMKDLPAGKLPRSFKDNSLITSGSEWWCSGFYPGALWYLYEFSGNECLKTEAIARTALLENEKNNKSTHDLGFMLHCSYGNGYRLLQESEYKDVLITAANSLISRYDTIIGLIKSWDNKHWQFPVIIDNMMNLELLFYTTKLTSDSTYYKIAKSHAKTTLNNFYREDYSCFHLVDFDTVTGKPIKKMTNQGFSDESVWARGQAWGLYGYIVAYRETGEEYFLEHAKNIATFLLNHKNLPDDKIPFWDFDAPDIPNSPRDASSASILASALIELSTFTEEPSKSTFLNTGESILYTLSTDNYFAKIGTNGNFILKHSVGSIPHGSEIDVPLTYADYYYIEALMRYLKF